MDSAKRVRSNNFSSMEMEALVCLIEEPQNVIECKKTDAVSNREKDAEWEKLTGKFNVLVGTGRSSKQIRMKWDSWKKIVRKNYSNWKATFYGTGGGTGHKELNELEQIRILAIIGDSAIGIYCPFDSNYLPSDISNYQNNFQTNFHIDDSQNAVQDAVDVNRELNCDATKIELNPQTCSSSIPETTEASEKEEEWVQQNPAVLLRKRKHSSLLGSNNKTLQKRRRILTASPVRSKQEILLDKEIELIDLQMEIIKKESDSKEARNKEKHEMEMLILKKQLIND